MSYDFWDRALENRSRAMFRLIICFGLSLFLILPCYAEETLSYASTDKSNGIICKNNYTDIHWKNGYIEYKFTYHPNGICTDIHLRSLPVLGPSDYYRDMKHTRKITIKFYDSNKIVIKELFGNMSEEKYCKMVGSSGSLLVDSKEGSGSVPCTYNEYLKIKYWNAEIN